ncbi:MAG: hypothetical protein FD181_3601 [Prolixibacteraceae bacterium]|nr:MAG: hypothetical protein FD181_3601 [Prolixibacteraceae bacterium]
MNEKIPVPVTFNPHKHHFQFLLQRIGVWTDMEWENVEHEFLGIGENLLDFYTGDLTVEKICAECAQFFKSRNINDKITFSNWLLPLEYRKIVISDSSEWVIKKGKHPERFIHIHPAKKSPHTIRVRAATLKTVLTLMVCNIAISPQMNDNLLIVNKIRTAYLQFSPIKSLPRGKGIMQLWELFFKF